MKRSPLETAKEKGAWAARVGMSESDCPYPDKRKHDGRLTFSRAFRNARVSGYQNAKIESAQPVKGD